MARTHHTLDDESEFEVGTTTEQAGEEQAAAEDAGTGGGRYVMITDPETGEQIKRVDWIRKVFQLEGGKYYGDRGAIAKALTEIQGKKVPYQIVFAATKDLKHIKKPEPEPEVEVEVEA
jgi:hypothetical protein